MINAVFVLYTHTQTVCIRIGGKNQICIDLFRQLQSQRKGLIRFRIRIAHSREIAVRKLLLFDYMDVGEAKLF